MDVTGFAAAPIDKCLESSFYLKFWIPPRQQATYGVVVEVIAPPKKATTSMSNTYMVFTIQPSCALDVQIYQYFQCYHSSRWQSFWKFP